MIRTYATKGPWSDVHVTFEDGQFVCHECKMVSDAEDDTPVSVKRRDAADMVNHLDTHREVCDHHVCELAIEKIKESVSYEW
jgi:hypothetical protein